MKLSVGIFFGGLFGALGVLLFLVAFGTDYWLLATEVGGCSDDPNNTKVEITFHHEGFFWRCWFAGDVGEETNNIWKFWYTNQSPSKNCTHAYLSPFPLIRDEHNSTAYDSAIIYRGVWTVLMLLGVITVLVASFFIICAAPFASHILYKAGGGIFIAAGILFSLVVVMYVIWVQAMADLENYMNMKKIDCPDFAAYVRYGWSFILAPIGIFFALFAGMLFLLVGHTIKIHSNGY
ncbi:transmembrane protein 182 [Carettochelys insculpta]|uniref:transmembrane protein 182 n=1 Tax=Carettochelys insculpta TaxID=44489 RepID=UPI003EBAE662